MPTKSWMTAAEVVQMMTSLDEQGENKINIGSMPWTSSDSLGWEYVRMIGLSSEFESIWPFIEAWADLRMQWCHSRESSLCFFKLVFIGSVFTTTSTVVVPWEKGIADDLRHQRGLSCSFLYRNSPLPEEGDTQKSSEKFISWWAFFSPL